MWCVRGRPAAIFDGELIAIRFAREDKLSFLGCGGGFQHALIEYARNVSGILDTDHGENSPDSASLLIRPLICSLKGTEAAVRYIPDTKLYRYVGLDETREQFVCNFGFNREYRHIFTDDNLTAAAIDDQGDLRAFELRNHPFFVGALFQPELPALSGNLHPIINAFFRSAVAQ